MTLLLIVLPIALAVCAHGWHGTTSLPLPAHLSAGGNYQFLTNLALLLTVAYLVVAIATALLCSFGRGQSCGHGPWRRIGYYLHMTMFNINFLVCSTYWVLYFGFPHFLNAGAFEVSTLLDVEIHLVPYLVLLADHWYNHRAQRRTNWTLVTTIAVLCAYWLRIELVVAANEGTTAFPYPFLRGLSFAERLQWLGLFIVVACTNQLVVLAVERVV